MLTRKNVDGIQLTGGTILGTSRGGADIKCGVPRQACRLWRLHQRTCCHRLGVRHWSQAPLHHLTVAGCSLFLAKDGTRPQQGCACGS